MNKILESKDVLYKHWINSASLKATDMSLYPDKKNFWKNRTNNTEGHLRFRTSKMQKKVK